MPSAAVLHAFKVGDRCLPRCSFVLLAVLFIHGGFPGGKSYWKVILVNLVF